MNDVLQEEDKKTAEREVGRLQHAYEDGTESEFRNVGN